MVDKPQTTLGSQKNKTNSKTKRNKGSNNESKKKPYLEDTGVKRNFTIFDTYIDCQNKKNFKNIQPIIQFCLAEDKTKTQGLK